MDSVPLKPATNLQEQIELLRSRGMCVDEKLCKQWLRSVSYYRLSAYWYPSRQTIINSSGTPTRKEEFIPGTNFSDAVHLYEADRKLRTLIHDGIERVEVALRAHIGELLVEIESQAYKNPDNFRGDDQRPNFKWKHSDWVNKAEGRVRRAEKHSEAIKHYNTKYDGNLPFWVLADVLDFSDISRLYEGLKTPDQTKVAESFGIKMDLSQVSKGTRDKAIKRHPLARWLEQLTVVRNSCAHHSRVWNKSFTPAPTNALRTVPALRSLPEGQSERIYGSLTLISFLLETISPGSSWKQKLDDLLRNAFLSNPMVKKESLGLPEDW